MPKHITAPFSKETLASLRAGDQVLISGTIYSARDAAHRRMYEALKNEEEMPINLSGVAIYYMGPTPARSGRAIGSAGPTTAGRMDAYTPALLAEGMVAMIGKGRRSPTVIEAIKKHGAVYFATIGGAGALLSQAITAAECVAYADLGPEAIYRLEVRDFPAFVMIDGGR
ncbi:MAG: FumA C-terminus/TtdB family hydratase beta subunit [Lachnospiraceae bacterium]|jgi:fumarate hydratase subunit beta|nr:FumA C-terminus/TtdB family hydratase beta subunit [Lachnospiraceae bacterium]